MFCTQSPRVLGAKHVLDPEYIPFNPRFCTCDWFARPRPGAPCGRCTRIKRDAGCHVRPTLDCTLREGPGAATHADPHSATACRRIGVCVDTLSCRPGGVSCAIGSIVPQKSSTASFPHHMELRKMPAYMNDLQFSSVQFKLSSTIIFKVQAHLVWSVLGIILFLFDHYIQSSVQVHVLVTAN